MPIRFVCPYGHPLVVPDERAGKKGRCPVCHQKLYVPVANPQPTNKAKKPSDEVEISSDVAAQPAPAEKKKPKLSSLDEILAEELGLDFEPISPPAEIASPPPALKPAAAMASPPVANAPAPSSPYSYSQPTTTQPSNPQPSAAAPFESSFVPPPGAAMSTDSVQPAAQSSVTLPSGPNAKLLTSGARPVAEQKPPGDAVPSAFAPSAPVGKGALVPTPAPAELPAPTVVPHPASPPPQPAMPPSTMPPQQTASPPVATAPMPPPPSAPALPATSPWSQPVAPVPSYTGVPSSVPAAPSYAQQSYPPPPYSPAPPMPTSPGPYGQPPIGRPAPGQPAAAIPSRMQVPSGWWIDATDTETQWAMHVRSGWLQTTVLFAAAMVAAALFGIIPVFKYWSDGVLPAWLIAIVGLSCLEVALAVWLMSLPDWSMLTMGAVACGLVAAAYASGLAMVITNQSAGSLPLDLIDVRNTAGGWCTGNALAWGMISYAMFRSSRLWRRNTRRYLRVS